MGRAPGHVRLGAKLRSSISRAQQASGLIVTPRYERFLRDNPEIVFDTEIVEEVTAGLVTAQESRIGRLGGSSAGQCYRRQVLSFLGAPAAPIDWDLKPIYEDGKWRHMRIQATLRQAGIIDRVEVPVRWTRQRAFGSIDGAGVVPDDHPNPAWRGKEFGVEIKGAMSFAWGHIQANGPSRYYDQIARYFLFSGFDLFVILVESKDTQRMLEYVISEEEVAVAEQELELAQVNRYIDKRHLPPMLDPCVMGRGPAFRNCPFGQTLQGSCHQHSEKW